MDKYSLSRFSDQELLRDLDARVGRVLTETARLIACLAEVDARKLYLPAGDDSMFSYCVRRYGFTRETAFKRIRAGRAARQFPVVFEALADGRLSLSAVVLLASHLSAESGNELLAAAMGKSKSEIEQLLAARFPQPDVPPCLQALPARDGQPQLSPGTVGMTTAEHGASPLSPGTVEAPQAKVAPVSAEWFLLQAMIPTSARDKLLYIQALLGHAVPTGDLSEVLERAFDAYITLLEKQKFAATSRPRAQRGSQDPRHISAAVKRAVWQRDGGQCGFVGEDGHRCGSRKLLEFDHVDPVARGGEATVDAIRLRCRAHNQYEAECAFGAGFMASKREAAQLAAAEARARAETARAIAAEERARAITEKREKTAAEVQAAEARKAEAQAAKARAAAEKDPDRSVIPWLRQLGFRADEARRGAERCESMGDSPLEQRVRVALASLARPSAHRPARIAPN